jgi:hypothetical protein
MGAVPAFLQENLPAFSCRRSDVLRVPAAEPILRSWVPFETDLHSGGCFRLRRGRGSLLDFSAASARAGVSISTLKVRRRFP